MLPVCACVWVCGMRLKLIKPIVGLLVGVLISPLGSWILIRCLPTKKHPWILECIDSCRHPKSKLQAWFHIRVTGANDFRFEIRIWRWRKCICPKYWIIG